MDLKSLLAHANYKLLVPPQTADDAALASNGYIDTMGLDAILFLAITGDIDAALGSTDATHALKIEECETSGGSYTDVSDAALAAAIPAATGDNKIYGIMVDLTKTHKRYMRFNAPTAGNATTGVFACMIAIAFPAGQLPNSAAEMGLAEFVQVPKVTTA